MLREDWDFVSLVIDEKEEVVDLFFEDVHVRNMLLGAAPRDFKTLYCLSFRNEIKNPASPPPFPSLPPRPGPGAFLLEDGRSSGVTGDWPARYLDEPNIIDLGLIKEEFKNKFSRIRLVRWLKQSVFEGTDPSIITII